MALILSIETSGQSCSVSLNDQGTSLGFLEVNEPQAHAARLAVLIEKVVESASVAIKDLKAVAVSAGPGSYTGLRIGVSSAKGICLSLGIPLIAINTLDVLAFHAKKEIAESGFLCPMIDARRMEVYCQVLDEHFQTILPVAPRIIDSDSFSELLRDNRLFFFGDGAEKCRAVLKHPNAIFLGGIYPTARTLGEMARVKFGRQEFENLEEFTPLYLKEFVAKKAHSFF